MKILTMTDRHPKGEGSQASPPNNGEDDINSDDELIGTFDDDDDEGLSSTESEDENVDQAAIVSALQRARKPQDSLS